MKKSCLERRMMMSNYLPCYENKYVDGCKDKINIAINYTIYPDKYLKDIKAVKAMGLCELK